MNWYNVPIYKRDKMSPFFVSLFRFFVSISLLRFTANSCPKESMFWTKCLASYAEEWRGFTPNNAHDWRHKSALREFTPILRLKYGSAVCVSKTLNRRRRKKLFFFCSSVYLLSNNSINREFNKIYKRRDLNIGMHIVACLWWINHSNKVFKYWISMIIMNWSFKKYILVKKFLLLELGIDFHSKNLFYFLETFQCN